MKSRIKKIISALKAGRDKSKGKKRYFCPCCGNKNEFSAFGIANRDNALCPVCKSLERHRFLSYIYNIFIFSQKQKLKVLHMAPEKCLYDLFKTKENVEYTTMDIDPLRYAFIPDIIKANVIDMPFEDKWFDVIVSNHVMEHIEDEAKFLSELSRVLKDSGKILMTVPYRVTMEKTLELPEVQTDEERLKHYGQHDHVRLYGRDIVDRLSRIFNVSHLHQKDIIPQDYELPNDVIQDCFVLSKNSL